MQSFCTEISILRKKEAVHNSLSVSTLSLPQLASD